MTLVLVAPSMLRPSSSKRFSLSILGLPENHGTIAPRAWPSWPVETNALRRPLFAVLPGLVDTLKSAAEPKEALSCPTKKETMWPLGIESTWAPGAQTDPDIEQHLAEKLCSQ